MAVIPNGTEERIKLYATAKTITYQTALTELLTNALDTAGHIDWYLTDPEDPAGRVRIRGDLAAIRRTLGFFGYSEAPPKPATGGVHARPALFRHPAGREVLVAPVSKARDSGLD